jgi:hypothetical protein
MSRVVRSVTRQGRALRPVPGSVVSTTPLNTVRGGGWPSHARGVGRVSPSAMVAAMVRPISGSQLDKLPTPGRRAVWLTGTSRSGRR